MDEDYIITIGKHVLEAVYVEFGEFSTSANYKKATCFLVFLHCMIHFEVTDGYCVSKIHFHKSGPY